MITASPYGTLHDGTPVTRYRLQAGPAAYADVLDYGATLQSLVLPDRNGNPVDVVLGYDSIRGYEAGDCYFGATVGRCANRIGNAAFTIDGTAYSLDANDGKNHLHGGLEGFDSRMFTAEISGETLLLSLVSPDGDQGYPGRLSLTVAYSFDEDKVLTLRFRAGTDRDTVVNLTNHSYFDLSGGRAPMEQRLQLHADRFCENDEHTLPTGRLLPVHGTPFDFTTEKPLSRDLSAEDPQLLLCNGYDHNFDLGGSGALRPAARLRSDDTGVAMTLSTDMPGVQLYTGNFVHGTGKGGREYHAHDAVCLEPQFFPNAMAVEDFEKPILRAGETYDRTIVFAFHADP